MDSTELKQYVQKVVQDAQARIVDAEAREQYDFQDVQRFELEAMDGVLELLEEEFLDAINYSVMLVLKVRFLREVAGAAGVDNSD
jgi:hypothetical protein